MSGKKLMFDPQLREAGILTPRATAEAILTTAAETAGALLTTSAAVLEQK